MHSVSLGGNLILMAHDEPLMVEGMEEALPGWRIGQKWRDGRAK